MTEKNAVKSETVSPAREWIAKRMGESGWDVGRAVQDIICAGNLDEQLALVLAAYAAHVSSLSSQAIASAAKEAAAREAAREIVDRYATFDSMSRFQAIVDTCAAIIVAAYEKARRK